MVQLLIMNRISLGLIILLLIAPIGKVLSKVEPPNYNFSLETLKDFYPDSDIKELEKKYGAAEIMSSSGGNLTLRFYVAHLRYKFAVIVQAQDGKVLDMFAKLPSYFLHDIFHQSLINRLGKQNEYKKVGEEAVYKWNGSSLTHVYSGACTITCFPIFYSVFPTVIKPEKPFTPLIEQMKNASKK